MSITRWLAWGLAFPAVVVPFEAEAQTAVSAPAVRETVDANGVDLIRGAFNASTTDVSIGQSGAHGLSYTRSWEGDGWRDNLSSGISGSTQNPVVTINGGSDSFTLQNGGYVPDQGNGATLTVESGSGDYLYTSNNGTVARFASTTTNAGIVRADASVGWIRSITYPDGVVTSYDYETQTACEYIFDGYQSCTTLKRLVSVMNTVGYKLFLKYRSDSFTGTSSLYDWATVVKVKAVNTKVANCDPNADSCASVGLWPAVTYDAPNPTVVTSPGGRDVHYSYDENGRLSGMRRPGAASDDLTIGYDGNGRVGTIGKLGASWNYTYAENQTAQTRTVTTTNPDQTHRTFVADTYISEPKLSIDENGAEVKYLFNFQGHLSSVSFPDGNGTSYLYDSRGNVTETDWLPKPNSGLGVISTSAGYEVSCSNAKTCNQPKWTRDASGNQTDYEYDGTHGGLTLATAPAASNGVRPRTRTSYSGYPDQVGGTIYLPSTSYACRTQSLCDGSSDQIVTSVDYGSVSNNLLPQSVTHKAGDNSIASTRSMQYDAIGNLVVTTDPIGAQTQMRYNADRWPTETIFADPDGGGPRKPQAVRTNYNADGTIASREAGTDDGSFVSLQQTITGYDSYGRMIQTSGAGGGTFFSQIQYIYDSKGRLRCSTVRMNPAAFGALPNPCVLGQQGSDGPDRITVYDYDAADRIVKVTGAYGTDTQATIATKTYTANGQVASMSDANGNVTTYGYDGHDRLSTTTYSGGSYEGLGYDANGNVKTRRLRDGQTLSFDYDGLNQLTYVHNPRTNIAEVDVSYAYDNLNHIVSAGDGNGWTKTFAYDALGRATQQGSNVSNTTLQYDAAGKKTRQTWGDGFYVTYEYDKNGNMTAIRENGGPLLVVFEYDDQGRRTRLGRSNNTETRYSYDAASRLMSLTQDLAGTASDQIYNFTYNSSGQIASRTTSNDAYAWTGGIDVNRNYLANGLNQYTRAGGTDFSYDARGNLTSSGDTTYQYNTRNQLFANGSGQLIYRNPAGELGQTPGINYDWVNGQLAQESANSVQRRYIYGPGNDEVVVWYEGSGTSDRRWLHADERGSIVAVSDGTGNALAINSYDEYGIPGTNNKGRFQYTGQVWLPELGMYDYKARMYSPTLGRFMQTDPIGYADGMNWYNYVSGDPVNGTDPSGLEDNSSGTTVVTGTRSPLMLTPFGATADNNISRFDTDPNSGGGPAIIVNGVKKTKPLPAPGNQPSMLPQNNQTKHCYGPPRAVAGVSASDLAKQLKTNGNQAASHSAADLGWFYQQVRNKGTWDYKQNGRGYENFGNYNFGYTGTRQGIPGEVLLEGAGMAQLAAGTSSWDFIMSNWDDPNDQEQIRRGISDAQNQCY